MAKDVIITPLDGDIQFSNASGTDAGKIEQSGDDLVISNAVGDVLLGDGTADVYIGDGSANVDIVFEQNGSIRGEAGGTVALTLGSSDTTLKLGSDLDVNGKSIVSASNGDITIIPNGTGNVGIGTASPSDKLHVNGTFRSNAFWTNSSAVSHWGSGSTAYGGLTWDTGYATVYSTTGNVLRLGANGSSPDVTIDTSGNVGIGTSSPSDLLEIDGGAASSFIQMTSPNTHYSGIRFGDPESTTAGRIQYYHGDDSLQFDTTSKFTFEGGSVGIGVTSPESTLHVRGQRMLLERSGANDAYIESRTTNAGAYFTANSEGSPNYYGLELVNDATAKWFIGSYGNSSLEIKNGAKSTGTVAFAINSSNNVGIGTSSPSAKLDVAGDVEVNGQITINDEFDPYTLPAADGTSGQVLQTNGTGTLSFASITQATGNELVDGDFTSQGIMLRGASSGSYSILTNNSTNWNTAFSWGDHSLQGYLTDITTQRLDQLSDVYSSMSPTDGQVLTYDTTNGWQAETPSSGGVTASGTPVAYQVAVFDGSSSIEGDSNLLWTGTQFTVGGGAILSADLIKMNGRAPTSPAAGEVGAGGNVITQFHTSGSVTAGGVYVAGSSAWVQADADAGSTATGLLAVATDAASAAEMLIEGSVKLASNTGFSTASKGDVLYLSLTAGELTNDISSHTTGDFVRVCGYVIDASKNYVYFSPSKDWIEL